MLRKLARWPGSRIALLWIVLVAVQGTCAWYIRVPDESPQLGQRTTPLELESRVAPVDLDSGPPRTGGIRPIFEFADKTVLSYPFLIALFVFVAGMALVLYGPAVAMLVLTALWLVARRKYGRLRA